MLLIRVGTPADDDEDADNEEDEDARVRALFTGMSLEKIVETVEVAVQAPLPPYDASVDLTESSAGIQ